jgi:DnaJ family protein C protein 25
MTVALKKSLVWLVLCFCLFGATTTTTSVVRADDEASPPPKQDESTTNSDGAQKVEHRASRPLAKEIPVDTFDVKSHFDWGTYYDPKNVFCGKFDCYGILGFDYESFDQEKPTQKMITKRYRALSRHWHPDKSKHPEAKERFQVRVELN